MLVRPLLTVPLLAVALAATVGCAAPPPSAGVAVTTPEQPGDNARRLPEAAQDARLAALRQRQQKLELLLAEVERKLLDAVQRVPESPADAEPEGVVAAQQAAPIPAPSELGASVLSDAALELLERRLVITVALARVEQAILRRQLELGLEPARAAGRPATLALESPDAWTRRVGSLGAVDPTRADVGTLLQQAELDLDEMRRRRVLAQGDRGGWAGPGSGRPGGGVLAAGGKDVGIDGKRGAVGGELGDAFGAGIATGEAGLGTLRVEDKRADGRDAKPERKKGAELESRKRDKSAAKREPHKTAVRGKGGGFFGEATEEEDAPAEASRRASVVAYSAPPAGVMAALRRHFGAMLECIPATTRAEGPIRFRVKTRLGADGQLHEPVVNSGGLLPPDVVGCLVDLLLRARVPAPADGASRVIAFPIWLSVPE